MQEESTQVITGENNPFITHPAFIPLGESEEGYLGQVGWFPTSEGNDAVYDFDVPVWEYRFANGIVKKYRRGIDCFGHPGGTCNQKQEENTRPYCRDCYERFNAECVVRSAKDRREQIIEDLISCHALPDAFRHFIPPMALTAAQSVSRDMMLDEPYKSAWIFGKPGVGKTILAHCMVHDTLNKCKRAAITDDGALINIHQHNRGLWIAYENADLLLIDDPLKFYIGKYGAATLFALLNVRHNRKKRTIITSEVDMKAANVLMSQASEGTQGTSLFDRLRYPGADCLQIELTGDNLRRA
jgi:DNA replication protein DnaC